MPELNESGSFPEFLEAPGLLGLPGPLPPMPRHVHYLRTRVTGP